MTLDWFRLWHDMPTDPKWRTIARVSKQRVGDVISIYLFVLTNASQSVTRGVLHGLRHEDVATALDMDESAVKDVFDAMQGRVLDGDKISGWEIRQPKREDSSTERMRKKRERDGVTQSDASVTQCDAPDETRLDKKEPPKTPKGEDPDLFKTPKPKRKRKLDQEPHPSFERFKEVYPSRKGAQGWPEASGNFVKLVNAGEDPEILIKAAQTYATGVRDKTGDERKYVMQAVSFLGPRKQAWQEFANGTAVVSRETIAQVSPDQWGLRVRNFMADDSKWARDWGPKPGEAGCGVPPGVLEQFNERRRET